jgi:Concanavalin A-like lectin/glucanases superfamily
MTQGIFTMAQQLQGQVRKTWGNSVPPPYIEYLVVAGGGGGGATIAGGAGAGGLLQGLAPITAGQSITVTVGAGGTGTPTTGQAGYGATGHGANSVFGSITAIGGGVGTYDGGPSNDYFANGGSGGGAGRTGRNAGLGIAGQGNSGGTAPGLDGTGAGGGGAGSQGVSASTVTAGNGGSGIASTISGTLTAYAGGGGGGIRCGLGNPITSVVGVGGTGGGGCGSVSAVATAGTANTGGGGGGGGYNGTYWGGGNGGSGIVIISYPDTYNAPVSFGGANSPTSSTSGSGSMYFNGSNYMAYGGQSQFAFGTGAFTIEFWIYQPSLVGSICLDFRPATGVNGAYGSFELNTNGQLNYYANSAYQISSNTGVLVAGTWQHIALARSGTSTKLFVNGTQVGSTYSDSTNYSVGSTAPYIGAGAAANALLTGYISNLRIVKGTAVYTSNFTVPTTPLTAITNTSLLLNTVSGSLFADASGNALTPPVYGAYLAWNQLSPFATGLGYKNRVYKWTGSGTVTF